jgi:tRNA pseudouridine38-40 synthase
MNKYKLTLAYDGSQYGGWQIQHNSLSIQSLVENALSTALRTKTSATASGRTDAGVHATGQIVHFTTTTPIDIVRLAHSLNGLLPRDIRVLDVTEVSLDFHARYSAISKEYHYHLSFVKNPFKHLFAWRIHTPLDLIAMQAATHHFIGTHDFATFTNAGGSQKETTRTLFRLTLEPEDEGVRLEFVGNGFLYKMVRNITGTLLAVGQKKLIPSDIPQLLHAQDRRKAPAAAPPHGLFLVKVCYNIE